MRGDKDPKLTCERNNIHPVIAVHEGCHDGERRENNIGVHNETGVAMKNFEQRSG
jgi:hypothetical protein